MGNKHSRAAKKASRRGGLVDTSSPTFSDALRASVCTETEPTSPASASAACVTDDRFSLTQWKVQYRRLFNDLESREEADLLELTSFLNALHEYMPRKDDVSDHQLSRTLSTVQIDISDMYEGVRLDYPLTRQNAIDLVDGFKRHQPLHREYVMQILFSTLAVLQDKPNVTYLNIAPHPHLTVVGDLHGQLDDLLLIFHENGLPSPTNPYIFNGDLVDRGPRGVECALIIFAFVLLYPDAVHVNRGNHEDKYINVSMGFMKLAVVLDQRILILHGGVPRQHTLRLDELDAIPRSDYEVTKEKPPTGASPSDILQFKQNQIIQDILWSDPMTLGNDWAESRRGAGINYGANHVHKFMAHNKLDWIIRSHECVPQGFAWPYGDKVTLFSASNYCGVANNLGCFMRIPSGANDAKPSFYHDLLERFEAADEAKSHVIPVSSWEHIMDDVLQVKLNWTIVRPLVTSTEPADPQAINYVEFLYRYQVRGLEIEDEHDGGQRVAEDTRKRRRDMFNNMYRYRKRLQALFQVFDQDGNGTINLDELKAGIEILNEHLPVGMKPFTHPEDLMKSLDFTHDNEININEFMECFRIHANLTAQAKWRHAKSKLKIMSALGMLKVVSDAPVVTASDVSFDKDSESISPVVVMRTDGNDDSVVACRVLAVMAQGEYRA
ncbi:hypothetical protein DYB28_001250, partial [Aphanomyces astaci]